jgi:multimeric flavodoxin WrbA
MAIVGISGSPISNSNTDRMIQSLLAESGKESKFVKLSKLNFSPCRGCAHLCATTAMCGVKDALHPWLAAIRDAEALVIGSPRHHGTMTAWTNSFFSRLWCFLHDNCTIYHKPVVFVSVGLFDEKPGRETFRSSTVKEHQFNVLGELHHKTYNPPCIKCGKGNTCMNHGGLWKLLDHDEEALRNFDLKGHQFTRFEDDPETVHEIKRLGEKLSAL